MLTIYVDADACPVKAEIYRVAGRYKMPVVVVAKSAMRVPTGAGVELVECAGFGEVDDWIAERRARRHCHYRGYPACRPLPGDRGPCPGPEGEAIHGNGYRF